MCVREGERFQMDDWKCFLTNPKRPFKVQPKGIFPWGVVFNPSLEYGDSPIFLL